MSLSSILDQETDVASVSGRLANLSEDALREVFQKLVSGGVGDRLVNILKERLIEEGKYSTGQYEETITLRKESETDQVPLTEVPRWLDKARIIPLRVSAEERRLLTILDKTLRASEYTDKVDVYIRGGARNETIKTELNKFSAIVTGLVQAHNSGGSLSKDATSGQQASVALCRRMMEVGRRYKILNPDRMRESYGKLMFILQDTHRVGFGDEFIGKVKTVKQALDESNGSDDLTKSPLLKIAVEGINATDRANAIAQLTTRFPSIDVQAISESFRDFIALEKQNFGPLDVMIKYLKEFFDPISDQIPSVDKRLTSLAIQAGVEGSRLTHNHTRQFQFVSQSLSLWREVLKNFVQLWHCAESDLLNEATGYRLADTGQGLNRVQTCGKLSNVMHKILDKVQKELGGWVGSSAIHLGDHNVPNALVFIDKYSQIPRILRPISHCLEQLDKEYDRWGGVVKDYIDRTFGGVENAKRRICADFFKHGFNGSGADNFFDAGSCIDGRLTSTWNWCSLIERKSYFPLFLLTGFVGFDGAEGW